MTSQTDHQLSQQVIDLPTFQIDPTLTVDKAGVGAGASGSQGMC